MRDLAISAETREMACNPFRQFCMLRSRSVALLRSQSIRSPRWLASMRYGGLAIAAVISGVAHSQQLRDEGLRLLDEQKAREKAELMARPPAEIAEHARVESANPGGDVNVNEIDEAGPTVIVREIVLSGDQLLTHGEQQQLVAPFLGRPLGAKRIDLLLQRITAAYLDRGYITTRAYLSPQNLQSGRLEITIIPGVVESIALDGQPCSMAFNTGFAVFVRGLTTAC